MGSLARYCKMRSMIIEGLITTRTSNGRMHLAPIGPHVDPSRQLWTLKPFQSSTTFQNLHRDDQAVFHVTDDALLLAGAVLGVGNESSLAKLPAEEHRLWTERLSPRATARFDPEFGWILDDACEFFALRVSRWDVTNPRAIADCQVLQHRQIRPFWGWNRAKHSIVELAVSVSRIDFIPRTNIEAEFAYHTEIIHKSAGEDELMALELLSRALSR